MSDTRIALQKGTPAVLSCALRLLTIVGLFAALLTGLFPSNAIAADIQIDDVVKVTTDELNLRSDAGTDGLIRTTLELGVRLQVLDGPRPDDGYTWYKVRVLGDSPDAGRTGWVAADFIALDGTGDPDPVEFDDALGVRVVDGPVNLRDAAGLDGDVVTTFETGREVPVNGGVDPTVVSADGYSWIAVFFGNGIPGFVATDFLEPLDYSPNLGSDDGWTTSVGVDVVNGPVNIRDKPSLDGEVVATAETGAIFARWGNTDLKTADEHTWVKIKSFSSAFGWIAIDFLAPRKEIPCMDGPCYADEILPFLSAEGAVVTDGPVNLRSAAGTDNESVMILQTGDYLFLDKSHNQFPPSEDGYYWIEATVAGITGFVAIDFITPAD